MSALVEVLTKVYGFTNRLKVHLAFKDVDAAFATLNDLTEFLVSIDVSAQQSVQATLLESEPIIDADGELIGTRSVDIESPQSVQADVAYCFGKDNHLLKDGELCCVCGFPKPPAAAHANR